MLTLDQLGSDPLRPAREEEFSLPAITNFHGMVQATWGVSGIQNWICPPTGMATPTARLHERAGGGVRPLSEPVEYRWRAYEIERRAAGVTSVLRLPAGRPGVLERLRFDRAGRFQLVFGGLPRVWRFTDYWNLPPEDVPMLNVRRIPGGFRVEDTKTFGAAEFLVPGRLAVYQDLDAWREGRTPVERGRIGVAELDVGAGDEVLWHGIQGCEEPLEPLDPERAWASGRDRWEEVWRAAFTPGNAEFSGSLPVPSGEFERLYMMGVLSLLQLRRFLPRPTERSRVATGGPCIWSEESGPLDRAYVALGPEGGMTTCFLWELHLAAPLLARLDPAVLRAQLEAMLRIDLHRHWGVETVSGRGTGMFYGINPGAFLAAAEDYVRITGDRAWAVARLDDLRACCRPGLTDLGECQNLLECVAAYEHRVASFNALNARGMRFVSALAGDRDLVRKADALAREVLGLYAGGPFACLQPDGSRRVVRTVLDFIYVGRSLTEDLVPEVRSGMVAFLTGELMTPDWLRALSFRDPDARSPRLPSFQADRADHQATGAYDGWPALAASVLLRFGERERALAWLRRIQELTREGPFGQAHFIHPDGARKASFFNGNCYWDAAGAAFTTTLIEDAGPGGGTVRR